MSVESVSVLRRGRGNAEGATCPSKPDFSMFMYGETSNTDMLEFIKVSPDLPQHTARLGYTAEDKAALWVEASDYLNEFIGVDFRSIPVNDEGFKVIGDEWVMQARGMNFDVFVVYDTFHGHVECARTVGDEGIGIFPMKEGLKYHGTYGGEEGVDAVVGDVTIIGSYMVDLDGDGDHDRFRYWALAPIRTVDNQSILVCGLEHERFGLGESDGKVSIEMGPDGIPHFSFRMMSTFPRRFDW